MKNQLTVENLQTLITNALQKIGASDSICQRMVIRTLSNQGVSPVNIGPSDSEELELIVVGQKSHQAIRTSGTHVNVFALAGAALAAGSAPLSTLSSVSIFVAVLSACTITITPEQAAFFIAVQRLETANRTPTANAISEALGELIDDPEYDVDRLIVLVSQLRVLGIAVVMGAEPNRVIRHSEWTISVPRL